MLDRSGTLLARCFIAAALAANLLAAAAQAQNSSFYTDDSSMLPYYPYVVHAPDNVTDFSELPAIVFLHGTGSRGEPAEMDELCTWNGIGRRLKEHQAGNLSESSTLAAQRFLSIMPIAPNETFTEWKLEPLNAMVSKVQADWGFNPSKLYLTGYSMGARDGWKWAMQNSTLFAAVAFAAGEPQPLSAYGNVSSLADLPIRHYQGQQDYVSLMAESEQTQTELEAAGNNQTELIVLPGVSHDRMADAPWNTDLWMWLLSQSRTPVNAQLKIEHSSSASHSTSVILSATLLVASAASLLVAA